MSLTDPNGVLRLFEGIDTATTAEGFPRYLPYVDMVPDPRPAGGHGNYRWTSGASAFEFETKTLIGRVNSTVQLLVDATNARVGFGIYFSHSNQYRTIVSLLGNGRVVLDSPISTHASEMVRIRNIDPAMSIGYNVTNGGPGELQSEPQFGFTIEADFLDSGTRMMEMHVGRWVSPDGLTEKRLITYQIERDTGKLRYALIKGDPLQILGEDGTVALSVQPSVMTMPAVAGFNTLFEMRPWATGSNVSVIQMASGQQAAAVTLVANAENLELQIAHGGIAGQSQIFFFGHNGFGAMSIGLNDNSGGIVVQTPADEHVAFRALPHSPGQFANLYEAYDTDGSSLRWAVNKRGIPISPSYQVAGLPNPAECPGATAFAANGRKATDQEESTGVLIYSDGSHWLRTSDDTIVTI